MKKTKLFPITKIIDNSTTDFDLFLQTQFGNVLYGNHGYFWERDELNRLIHHGYENFITKDSDSSLVDAYIMMQKLPVPNLDTTPTERLNSIQDIAANFSQCLYANKFTQPMLRKGKEIASHLVESIEEDIKCINGISSLAGHDYYTYYHSVRVATYAVAIAVKMDIRDNDSLKQIALGGILHDIGKKNVPLTVINKNGPLTKEEWKLIRSHPSSGFEAVKGSLLEHIPREIILHHHEKLDGSGYPHSLKENSLIIESQITTLADIFDALTSNRSYQKRRTHYEALGFIKENCVNKNEINKIIYLSLVDILKA